MSEVLKRIHSSSPAETILAGEAFGREFISPGTVVALRGELGAGKTHFVKGVARALSIDEDELTSPTYALVNEYVASGHGEVFDLFHLDCYRFAKPEELLELGIEDYLNPRHAATIIEWPERIDSLLPKGVITVSITALTETEREISIETGVRPLQ